ncbi:error-prone DNA polymerase, DnaE-like [Sphingomonas sp. YR710]|uniref:error-prone DNA polymerase n=1 Tax=Sphingomonas sp. YR710 TaxID=1882773 RepID=UPI0008842A5E|nr:error-prone DNA polymerase [Sphingomonas sp. YR710]SDD29410.1 error-prone DNA polymerase, DnaE-like [Sphingomonas sp. YR710]
MTAFAGFAFAELVAASNYSFLRGASHPADMVAAAIAAGHRGIGIADRNTVAGVVRAHVALKEAQEKASEPIPFRLIVGARLVFADGTPDIVAYPATRFGWGRLTRLLSVGNLRTKKGDCELRFDDLLEHIEDLLLIVMPDVSEGFVRHPVSYRHPGEDGASLSPAPVSMGPGFRRDDEGGSGPRLIVDNTLSRHPRDDFGERLAKLTEAAPNRVWLGATMARSGRDRRRLARLARMAEAAGVPMIATNDALYATPEQRPLHDIVTCIREGVTIAEAGRRLEANAERHVKSGAEMARLFADHPEAIAETVAFLDRIGFTLDQLRYEYPHEPVPDGWTPQAWLEHLVEEGIKERYPAGEPDGLRRILDEELHLVRKVKYAYYFLTVHDIVRFARSKDILCQGRGSAANSIICYLLNITAVDPLHHKLLFSRFISEDRREPPDIDVDFEHERREEVMQYIYERYGRERAGIAATVIHYRPRSAVREVGKVLGLSEDVTARISSTVWGSYASHMEEGRFHESGFDPANPDIARLGMLVAQLLEFPRHLSQHVGGFVLTEDRLDETVPIHNAAMEDRTFIEWDKDDIDALGLMKVDILALGMLTCIRKAFDLIDTHLGIRYDLANVPGEDRAVYDMLCKGDSIGVFQVESRAQINMLPRLKPRTFYDLVIQVAIVRPGPIQGGMVHPYLRRRQGIEAVCFPSPSPACGPADELVGVLGKTLGVPLFQEQAMKLAIVAAGFTPADANRLRRAMATFRNVGTMPQFEAQMVGGMVGRGYDPDFARRCFDQIKGFGSYGFPESHALSFARLVYVSSYLKQYYPAVFACALLNSQPMGFYAPAQIVRDAREHGVEVLPADVNASGWDNSLEWKGDVLALRIGLRQIDGFREEWADAIKPSPPLGGEGWERGKSGESERALASSTAPSPRPSPPKGGEGGFCTIESLARRANLPPRALRLLADADAFRSIGLDRRQALWEVRRTPTGALPLFAAARARELGEEPDAALPAMPLSEHVAADYQTTRLSLKDHPMAFLRSLFRSENVASCREVSEAHNGRRIRVAGIVLVRQRPGEGKAIFITLEDETGITNVLLWARLFRIQRREVMAARLMEVEGEVQRSPEGVVHLMGVRVHDRTAELDRLSEDHQPTIALSRADVFEHPQPPRDHVPRGSHPRDVRILPRSRDFH